MVQLSDGLFADEKPDRYSPRLAIRALRTRHRTEAVSPVRSLIVCTNPRSGSWLLCTALAQTGLAGYPSEYFIPWDEADWFARWGVTDYRSFLSAMLSEGTSANRVFSAKVMWGHVGHLLDRVAELPEYSGLGAPEVFERVFPDTRYVWLRRRDRLSQAVSHARAIHTGVWATASVEQPDADGPGADDCDIELVVRLHDELLRCERSWQEFFTACGKTPLTVWYEDLVEDYPGNVRRVLGHAGMSRSEVVNIPPPDTRRQSDETNERWVRLCADRLRIGDRAAGDWAAPPNPTGADR